MLITRAGRHRVDSVCFFLFFFLFFFWGGGLPILHSGTHKNVNYSLADFEVTVQIRCTQCANRRRNVRRKTFFGCGLFPVAENSLHAEDGLSGETPLPYHKPHGLR